MHLPSRSDHIERAMRATELVCLAISYAIVGCAAGIAWFAWFTSLVMFN